MVTKRSTKSIRTTTRTPAAAETARKLWLASLGAVSLAEKQGRKIVETLVEEGEQFRARSEKTRSTLVRDVRRAAIDARKQVQGYVVPLKARAIKAAKRIESGFNTRFGAALSRFGVPTKIESSERTARVATRGTKVKRTARKRAA